MQGILSSCPGAGPSHLTQRQPHENHHSGLYRPGGRRPRIGGGCPGIEAPQQCIADTALYDSKKGEDLPWICLDEIHKMPKWKNILKDYFDKFENHCRFIITGSAAYPNAMPQFAAYTATKYATVGLQKEFANEYKRENITFNQILPTMVDTILLRGKKAGDGSKRVKH